MTTWKSQIYAMPLGAAPTPESTHGMLLELVGSGKRVLDFGCASGYLAAFMKANGCSVTGIEINPQAAEAARAYCDEVIVADLDRRSLAEILPGRLFDVVVFSDILEDLRDPWRVLDEARALLGPAGFAVLSIPNIAHGAVRLALLRGGFQYAKEGLLDEDHLRFFTLRSVRELCLRSGYRVDVMNRTKCPLVSSSDAVPKVDLADFHPSVIAAIESDPEHDTLQFIVRAVPMDGEHLVNEIQERLERQTQELTLVGRDPEEQSGVDAGHLLRIAALESALAESRERILTLEKNYHDVLADFTAHTANELAEIRGEAQRINSMTQAIQRSSFWALKMAIRRLYRFGRE